MKKIETIQSFYKTLSENIDIKENSDGIGHFNVFPRRYCSPTASFHRRDFYKISLITEGTGIIHFANEDFAIDRPGLFFPTLRFPIPGNPHQPIKRDGFACLPKSSYNHGIMLFQLKIIRCFESEKILLSFLTMRQRKRFLISSKK